MKGIKKTAKIVSIEGGIKVKKYLSLFLLLALAIGLNSIYAAKVSAQSKIIKKTVQKVVTPQIAPVEAPSTEPTPEAVEVPPPPPPIPPSFEVKVPEEEKGIFGWGINTALSGNWVFSPSLLGVRGDVVFSDPLKIGEKIGLAEDAVEYKLGLGFAFGNDSNNNQIKTIPLFADAVLYLKEGSLFGMDPYIGAGFNYNLYGTGKKSGGMGTQLYGGVLADFGFASGKTALSLGYSGYRVEGTGDAGGIAFTVTQPLKL